MPTALRSALLVPSVNPSPVFLAASPWAATMEGRAAAARAFAAGPKAAFSGAAASVAAKTIRLRVGLALWWTLHIRQLFQCPRALGQTRRQWPCQSIAHDCQWGTSMGLILLVSRLPAPHVL